MRTVKINQNDKTILVGVGGAVRVLDFSDGEASITLFEKGSDSAFLRLEFTSVAPLPKAETNAITLDVTLPRKEGA